MKFALAIFFATLLCPCQSAPGHLSLSCIFPHKNEEFQSTLSKVIDGLRATLVGASRSAKLLEADQEAAMELPSLALHTRITLSDGKPACELWGFAFYSSSVASAVWGLEQDILGSNRSGSDYEHMKFVDVQTNYNKIKLIYAVNGHPDFFIVLYSVKSECLDLDDKYLKSMTLRFFGKLSSQSTLMPGNSSTMKEVFLMARVTNSHALVAEAQKTFARHSGETAPVPEGLDPLALYIRSTLKNNLVKVVSADTLTSKLLVHPLPSDLHHRILDKMKCAETSARLDRAVILYNLHLGQPNPLELNPDIANHLPSWAIAEWKPHRQLQTNPERRRRNRRNKSESSDDFYPEVSYSYGRQPADKDQAVLFQMLIADGYRRGKDKNHKSKKKGRKSEKHSSYDNVSGKFTQSEAAKVTAQTQTLDTSRSGSPEESLFGDDAYFYEPLVDDNDIGYRSEGPSKRGSLDPSLYQGFPADRAEDCKDYIKEMMPEILECIRQHQLINFSKRRSLLNTGAFQRETSYPSTSEHFQTLSDFCQSLIETLPDDDFLYNNLLREDLDAFYRRPPPKSEQREPSNAVDDLMDLHEVRSDPPKTFFSNNDDGFSDPQFHVDDTPSIFQRKKRGRSFKVPPRTTEDEMKSSEPQRLVKLRKRGLTTPMPTTTQDDIKVDDRNIDFEKVAKFWQERDIIQPAKSKKTTPAPYEGAKSTLLATKSAHPAKKRRSNGSENDSNESNSRGGSSRNSHQSNSYIEEALARLRKAVPDGFARVNSRGPTPIWKSLMALDRNT